MASAATWQRGSPVSAPPDRVPLPPWKGVRLAAAELIVMTKMCVAGLLFVGWTVLNPDPASNISAARQQVLTFGLLLTLGMTWATAWSFTDPGRPRQIKRALHRARQHGTRRERLVLRLRLHVALRQRRDYDLSSQQASRRRHRR
jgi:hypothetical protein